MPQVCADDVDRTSDQQSKDVRSPSQPPQEEVQQPSDLSDQQQEVQQPQPEQQSIAEEREEVVSEIVSEVQVSEKQSRAGLIEDAARRQAVLQRLDAALQLCDASMTVGSTACGTRVRGLRLF